MQQAATVWYWQNTEHLGKMQTKLRLDTQELPLFKGSCQKGSLHIMSKGVPLQLSESFLQMISEGGIEI